MQLMSMPAVAGISLGVAIASIFSRKHRGKPIGERTLAALGSFLAARFSGCLLSTSEFFCVQQS